MSVQFSCPECKAVLRSAKPIAPGKMIRCPKCEVFFTPEVDELEAEVVEEKEVRSSRRTDDYDDEDERDYEDEEEERPRRRKPKFKKKKQGGGSGTLMLGMITGGVVLLLLVVGGVLGYVDIPGMGWSGFLRTFGNKGTGEEELLAYVPADSDFVGGADFEELRKLSVDPGPALADSFGATDPIAKEALGIDQKELVDRIVVVGKVPQQSMGRGVPVLGAGGQRSVTALIIRTGAPINQKLLYHYYKKNQTPPSYAKANGKIYYKVDTSNVLAGGSYVFAPSDRTLILLPIETPIETVEQIVASDGKTVPLTGEAWSLLPEASKSPAWGVLALQGEVRNKLRELKKSIPSTEAAAKPLMDALAKAHSCGFWVRQHNERLIVTVSVACANAKAASTVKSILEQDYQSDVKGLTGQMGINAALRIRFKSAPATRKLLWDALNQVKFHTKGALATLSVSISRSAWSKAMQEATGLGAIAGGGGRRQGGTPRRRGPQVPPIPGLQGSMPGRGGPRR